MVFDNLKIFPKMLLCQITLNLPIQRQRKLKRNLISLKINNLLYELIIIWETFFVALGCQTFPLLPFNFFSIATFFKLKRRERSFFLSSIHHSGSISIPHLLRRVCPSQKSVSLAN